MAKRILPTALIGAVALLGGLLLLATPPRGGAPAAPSAQPDTPAPTRAAAPATAVPTVAAPATAEPAGPAAPDFVGGGAWLNSEPLTLAALRGKVVLVNFWTYGCYNCKNTLPYVREWWAEYRDRGLVIVGVHTPEFKAEHELANVQAAVQREEIGWPVVQDNDYRIWRAYGNRYWPRFYLLDPQGRIVYDHIGEGAYEETERRIVAALDAGGER